MAKAAKKATARKRSTNRIKEEEEVYWENNELIGEDGMIVKDTRQMQANRVILPRDIREASTPAEIKALDKKAYTEQLKGIMSALAKPDNKKRKELLAHLKKMKGIVEKKLDALK